MDNLSFTDEMPGGDGPDEGYEQVRVDRLVREIHDLTVRRDRGELSSERFLMLQNEKLEEIEEIGERLEREGRPRPRIELGWREG